MGLLVQEIASGGGSISSSTWAAYRDQLDHLRDRMSENLREFALSEHRYDPDSSLTLHDAWLDEVSLVEDASGERKQFRKINARVVLLGPQHDGHWHFSYRNVLNYSLLNIEYPRHEKYREKSGHGDLIVEDISIGPSGGFEHAFAFRWGGIWKIEARDIVANWVNAPRTS